MGDYILGNGQTIPGSEKAFSQPFNTREKSKHIGPKEMSAVLLAFNKWHTQLAGSKLLIFGDWSGSRPYTRFNSWSVNVASQENSHDAGLVRYCH